MKRVGHVVAGALLIAGVVSAALAVHYRTRAEQYRAQLDTARAALAEAAVANALPAAAPAPVRVRPSAVASDPAPAAQANAAVAALRAQVDALQQQVTEKDQLLTSWNQALSNRPPDRAEGFRNRFTSMESLRTNDPQRYEDFVQRRKEAEQTMQNAFALKADHLLKQDKSEMNDDEKAQYDEMMRLVAETWQLSQQMRADLPPDQRREVMRTLRDDMVALDPLLTSERTREFASIGKDIGYSTSESTNFAAYLNQVIDLTSMRNLIPGGRFRGGPGGGGPGGTEAAGPTTGTRSSGGTRP